MSRASILLLLALGLLALFACDADALRPRSMEHFARKGAGGQRDPAGEPVPNEQDIQQRIDETRARYEAKAKALKLQKAAGAGAKAPKTK